MPTKLGKLGLVADDVRVAVFEDHLVGLWLRRGRCRVVEGHDAEEVLGAELFPYQLADAVSRLELLLRVAL